MIVRVPVTSRGMVDTAWGRAARVAVANVVGGEILAWREVTVSWDRLHDAGTPGAYHARVVRFLCDQQVEAVVARNIGQGMVRMFETMSLPVHLGATDDARAAVLAASAKPSSRATVPADSLESHAHGHNLHLAQARHS